VSRARTFLLIRAGGRAVALGLAGVAEVMRARPIELIPGAPGFVLGTALIRGETRPVVDLAALLGMRDALGDLPCWVSVRTADRNVALAVESVIGVQALDPRAMAACPPLLAEALGDRVEALGRLDQALLWVLRDALQLPEEVWS
jgi:chemotaxis signal transduction protein